MIDYYLKTADDAAMTAALIAAGVVSEQGGQWLLSPNAAVDVIGIWYEQTGGTDEEPIMTPIPGWHFNVRSTTPIEWPETVEQMSPATPWRVWG